MRAVFKHGDGHKPGPTIHPKLGEKGKPLEIEEPSMPTPLDEFGDSYMVATIVPGGPVPKKFAGIPFEPWTDHPRTEVEWAKVLGQIALSEPPMTVPKGKQPASGVIIEEDDGRLWVVHPTNGFGGYKTTFPKGKLDHIDIPLQANAIKEAFEETGLKVEITGYIGDIERSTSVARYYRARRVGGSPADMGWETQAVSLVPRDEIVEFLNANVDRKLVQKLLE